MWTWLLALIYLICLLIIFGYALVQGTLAVLYLKAKKKNAEKPKALIDFPIVTIQLPVFNEKYVVDRLIKTVVQMDYPKDKLEIQILDDSTDETSEIIAKRVQEYAKLGFLITHVQRTNRVGFKAGALAEGLTRVKGEFIAIFDADFIPDKDFLKKTLPHFSDLKVGVVQTRWEHLNRNSSLLTKLQAFALDAHFSVEQTGRNSHHHFINFNGTAGIWRRETIVEAGGWENDTLTEDLDLSYRAQMIGWRFVYLEDVHSPAELPIAISALKNQQFRWVKGGAENVVKNGKRLLFQKGLRFSDRLHGITHLFNSSVYLFIFIMALITVPLTYAGVSNPNVAIALNWMALFFLSTLLLIFYYGVSYREKTRPGMKWFLFIWRFIQFLTVSLGLPYYNAKGVMQAYMGKKTAFVRTPKFNTDQKENWLKNAYLNKKWRLETLIELILFLYFLSGIVFSYDYGYYGMVPFQSMLTTGYGAVLWYSFKERNAA